MADTSPSAQVRTLTAAYPGEGARATLTRGDHIKVSRDKGYSHHGVYAGNGEVIHYSGEKKTKTNAVICRVSTAEFAQGGEVEVVCYNDGKCDPTGKVMHRAELYLGSEHFMGNPYNFLLNNCEHFARWCKTGKKEAKQVQRLIAAPVAAVAARQVALRFLLGSTPVGLAVNAATFVGGVIAYWLKTDKTKSDDTPKIGE